MIRALLRLVVLVVVIAAVAYFFGRELHKSLDMPVGMIATSWGAWI